MLTHTHTHINIIAKICYLLCLTDHKEKEIADAILDSACSSRQIVKCLEVILGALTLTLELCVCACVCVCVCVCVCDK